MSWSPSSTTFTMSGSARPAAVGASTDLDDEAIAQRADLERWLADYCADIGALAGSVTCRYSGLGESLIFESPTIRLSARPLDPTGLFEPDQADLCERFIHLRDVYRVFALMRFSATQRTFFPSLLNSTDLTFGASSLVEAKLSEAVASAAEEWFEDGIESVFSRTLSTLLYVYGDSVVAAVETFLNSPSANIEVAVEAVEWLGEANHPASHTYRKSLLEKLVLKSSSTRLRHGAAAGLAAMNDASSTPALLEAYGRETNQMLRRFLELVLAQFRMRTCRNS